MGPPRPGSSRASKRAPDREKSLLAELFALYAEADALHATTTCPASTECCRFGVTGREPYVTSLEILAIQRAVAAAGGPLNPRRRALPLAGNDGERERTCPLLAESGRCSIYASRPFGCRTYFCTRATRLGPIPREQEKALVARLRALAERHVPSGDLPRPLTQVLRGHGERRR
ncbi:MAG TPA: YkgJ family cysteine cluster protein [Polyangiaceae bacterium]|nr:YkgJ family cysteine cluster protein [Polyangiaceae bacterium]